IFNPAAGIVDGTLPGGTVNVAAGTYTEQLTVNRQLNILGPNAAIDPNTGSRVAEAVIRAAVNDTDPFDGADDENSIMVTITNTADGTVFKGFTLDGDNPLLDSNYVLNGADVDAYGGISGNGNINPAADISFNIVKNLGEFGIEVYGDPNAAGVRTNSRIANNKVDNVVGWFYGNAIFAGNNASTNVEDNVVTQSFGGIMIHHFNGQVTSRPNSVVDGNTITAFGYPIWFNLHYAYSGNGYTISNNTIDSYVEQDATPLAPRASNSKFEGDKEVGLKRPLRISESEPQNSVGGWGRWIGIKVESVNGLVPATFTDNNIDGNRALLLSDAPPYTQIDGFRITNPSTTSSNIVIKENNITDTNRGIAHTADALVDINCNNIYGNQIGIYIGSGLDYDGNPESADIGATIFNNNILGNAVFGVQAQTGTSAVNNASGNYWGAADGPGPVGPGTGDNVSNDVNFAGFLTIPSTCSPVAPPPTVTIEQVGPDPTNTSPINFTVTFSEAVTDFDDSSDIALSGTAGATTVVISGGPTVYNVAVSGMANDGTVIADVVAGAATGANGANVASSSLDNTVTYDTTSPTVGVEQKLGQNDPTNASPIEFTVTFSEPTANFVTGDVNLSASTAPGTLVGTVTGGPTVFNVAVTGMTGSGTVVASVDAGAATDAANNGNAASTSADNSVYYDVTNPTVTIDQQTVPAQADPTSTSPVNFSIVISDASAISGFDASDVTIATGAGTAFGGFAVPNVVLTGGPTTFNAAVSGMNQTGLVTATIAGGTFVDGAGNPNAASTSVDNNVQFNLVNTNITVTPSDMLGWSFVQENAGVASGRMMTGPATPPLGTGSARITVDATAGQAFMKDAYSGVRFADITALSYSAYQHSGANPSIHATLAFDVDSDVTDGINGYQGRIVYEPYNDPANTFTPATWQTFDAMSPTAKFWGSSGSGVRPLTVACPQSAPCTKAQILTLFPNLGIRNNVPMTSIGRVIFKVGSGAAPGLDASVDNLVIGVNSVNDTYNFDETPPTVSIANATIKETEAGQTLNLQLTRTGTSTLPASVTVNTSDGTATTADGDYTALTNQVVTIPASGSDPDTSVFVSVLIGGDGTVEPNETFTVTISNAVNAALGTTTATATIENNDVELSFALAAPNVGESAGTATITVNRNGATANAAGVSYATSAGTANPGPAGPFNPIDYVAASGPLSIPGAGTSTTFDITINPDLISEVNETVLLTLSTIVAGPGDNVTIVGTNPSTLTILDDDGGGLVTVSGTITKYTGGGGIENVTVSLFDGVTTVTTTTDAAGNYSFTGVPSGASFSLTPACVPANPTCNGYIYDASAREYLNAYSNVTGADFIGYLGDNPRDITFVDTVQPSAGANIVVPITIMSQGTENSADFVLLYDDTKIDYVSETCGVGAPAGCAVSSAPFPGGRKFELSLDPGVTYTAGLRELIRVTFAEDTVLPADFNTPVTFAATPRNVANPSGISVPADYVNGLVIFAKGIEADIAGGLPANSGYGDGGHNNGDVIRIRNLVVGAVTVNPSINEFQRADSAPYLSRGDGKLNSGDTTVARRHVTGDLVGILNPAAGPTVAIPFVDGLPSEIYGDKTRRPNRNAMPPITMTVVDRNAIRGANVTVAIDLVSEGIETGFSYSVHFDTASLQMPTGMTCPQVTLGPGWHAPATLDTNCTQAGMGRIGLNGFFNTFGTTFVPGTQRVILMTFFVPLSAPLGPTTLTFADMPVDDYVSDVNGDPVATTFDPGDVTIVATPTSSNAVVAGQVTNPSGIAVNRAQVSLTSSTGVVYRGTTNAFGNFTIEGVPAGATYIVTIGAKGYTFTPVSLNVTDSIGKIQLQLE
ncbi:MAG: carboxypeptidase regulatory-like domain-containing protein, partial [Blastocatellia bacterium]|nr:carboxypeptidase regulatory-like domain-containing protein [Blastocatellia bacterium]